MAHYGTAADVKARTGIRPGDLGLEDDNALDTLLDSILDEAADLIDRMIGTSYLTTTVPAGLTGIAVSVVSSAVRDMVATRVSAVVQVDDFTTRVLTARLFSDETKQLLRLYAVSGSTGLGGIGSIDINLADVSSGTPDALTAILLDEE